jgi:hypothetical protein
VAQNTLDTPSLETSSEKSERASLDVKKIWRILAPKLFSLVNITALLTVAGFFVINSYLASFSKLFTFNISLPQYLAAGINLVLGTFAYILYLLLPGLGYGVLLGVGAIIVYAISRFWIKRSRRIHDLWDRFRRWWLPIYYWLRPGLRFLWSLYRLSAGALLTLIVILMGLVYGTYYYAQSPRMLGGGMPAAVILVFREDQPTQNSIWGFSINSSNARQSTPVQLLIELTDGVIVRDAATNIVTVVKSDVLQGIIDAEPLPTGLTSITPIPTQTLATPTP